MHLSNSMDQLFASALQGVQSVEGLRFRLVDAKGQVVGRLASQIATILQVGCRPARALPVAKKAQRPATEACRRASRSVLCAQGGRRPCCLLPACPRLPARCPPQGKDKPTFCPNKDDGDVVVVVNAADVELTGRKWDQKLYRWHTGYPGGLKERTAKQMFAKKPDSILREAVLGMLPKNNLRRVRRGQRGRAGLAAFIPGGPLGVGSA